jgi:predicted phosphohydrolase
MNVYAIGDLHLSFSVDKPMDIFGAGWEGHFDKIKSDWQEKVQKEDIVLICGDTSWAMKQSDAQKDLQEIAKLPGEKIFVRGNHDYWWNGITKLRESAPDTTFRFLQTDATRIEGYVFVGTRGWTCPGSPDFTAQDEKLFLRETERLKLALADGKKLMQEGDTLVAILHYPPFSTKTEHTALTELLEEAGVEKAVFGHIHGQTYFPLKSQKNGVEYILASCDKVGFKLVKIY